MLNFSAVKCDLFYAREASFSIKLLRRMRIIGVELLNYADCSNKSKKSSEAFQRSIHIEGLYILKN